MFFFFKCMQSNRAEEFIDLRTNTIIVPDMLYCSVFPALNFLPKQSLLLVSQKHYSVLFNCLQKLHQICTKDDRNYCYYTLQTWIICEGGFFFQVKSGPNPSGVCVYCDGIVCLLLSWIVNIHLFFMSWPLKSILFSFLDIEKIHFCTLAMQHTGAQQNDGLLV